MARGGPKKSQGNVLGTAAVEVMTPQLLCSRLLLRAVVV